MMQIKKENTFIDLFSGIGGFRIGMELANCKHVFSNDYDKYANQTYTQWFGEDGHDSRSIWDISLDEIPSHDILCGGFPCQPFSNAGKKLGFSDPSQGNLFERIEQIVTAKRPKVVFLENVRTLVTHDGGHTMNTIDSKLTDLGYCGSMAIINAKFWVPQNRYRIFLVYFLENQEAANYMEQDLISIRESYGKEVKKLSSILEETPDKSFELPEGTWKALQRHKERHKGKTGFGYSLIEDFSKCANTLSARYAKDGAEILIKQKYWRRPRRLTLNEARALMGFDNDLAMKYGHLNGFPTNICSKAQHYKQFGNAVVPRIVADIAHKINKYI